MFGREQASITHSASCWYVLPHLSYELNTTTTSSRNLNTQEPYETVVFPMLFPSGKGGISLDKRQPNHGITCQSGHRINTAAKYAKYILYQKVFSHLALLPRLAEQFALDAMSRAESIRFDQIAFNRNVQDAYRTRRIATRQEVRSAVQQQTGPAQQQSTLSRTGVNWQIPASIPGTPGYMRRKIADGMAVVSSRGDPTLFITVTMAIDCEEVKAAINLLPPGSPTDPEMHPSIVVRIFRQKIKKLEELLRSGHIFGQKLDYLQRTHEWQKRGLIHCHIMIRLKGAQPVTGEAVDRLISGRLFHAEKCPLNLPQDNQDCDCNAHRLTRIIAGRMLHNCTYSQACRKKGKCVKGFPMPVLQHTIQIEGRWFPFRESTDTQVASHCPVLVLALNCHVHCDVCTGPGAAAYIRKYISKMPDQVRVRISQPSSVLRDELRQWEVCRHMSSSEACVRLIEMDVHKCEPGVSVLPIHREGQERINFDPDDIAGADAASRKVETLLHRYFWRPDSTQFSQLTYVQYHEQYVQKPIAPRRATTPFWMDNPINLPSDASTIPQPHFVTKREDHVCRLARIPLSNDTREDYCLRQIALEVTARSFKDWLIDQHGRQHLSYVACAEARGLFDQSQEVRFGLQYVINNAISSSEWDTAHSEGRSVVRQCTAEEVLSFWLLHLLSGATHPQQDFDLFWRYILRTIPHQENEAERISALMLIQQHLLRHRLTTEDVGLPFVAAADLAEVERARHDQRELQREALLWSQLPAQQKNFINDVEKAINGEHQRRLFYLKGDGGAGKTFTLKILLARQRLLQRVCLPNAFTGTAAMLYEGGDTAHRTFQLPIISFLDEAGKTAPKIKPGSSRCKLLIAALLIIIDEISMLSADYLRLIDETLRIATGVNAPFGGKVVIVAGDFKQLCPIAKSSTSTRTACALNAAVWPLFASNCCHLRSQFRSEDPQHTAFITRIGFGVTEENGSTISHDGAFDCPLPQPIKGFDINERANALQWLIQNDLHDARKSASNCAIGFTHEVVNQYNNAIWPLAAQAQGALATHREITSVNKSPKTKNSVHFAMGTPETLASFEDKGIPPHKLNLFNGAVCTLIRNLNVKEGLGNGTKCIVRHISTFVIEVEIVGGVFDKVKRKIPRIPFDATAFGTISFVRLQFPLKLAYAMTANRSQGQTFVGRVLVDTTSEAFSHGQVYVAASRTKRCSSLAFITPLKGFVRCVVWRDLLNKAGEVPSAGQYSPDLPVIAPAPVDINSDSDQEDVFEEVLNDNFDGGDQDGDLDINLLN